MQKEKEEEEEAGREGGCLTLHHEYLQLERESVQLGKSKVFLRKVRREGRKKGGGREGGGEGRLSAGIRLLSLYCPLILGVITILPPSPPSPPSSPYRQHTKF